MCNRKVTNLNDVEKRVEIITINGEVYTSPWFVDDSEKVQNKVNMTELEEKYANTLKEENQIEESQIDCIRVPLKRDKEQMYITEHAYQRMRERNGWNRKTSTRMIEKIYSNQNLADTTNVGIKRLIEQDGFPTRGTTVISYGGMLYVFKSNSLITVLYDKQMNVNSNNRKRKAQRQMHCFA